MLLMFIKILSKNLELIRLSNFFRFIYNKSGGNKEIIMNLIKKILVVIAKYLIPSKNEELY